MTDLCELDPDDATATDTAGEGIDSKTAALDWLLDALADLLRAGPGFERGAVMDHLVAKAGYALADPDFDTVGEARRALLFALLDRLDGRRA